MESVKPNWSGEAKFPRTIRVKVWASNAAWGRGNGRREIVIKDTNQAIPEAIVLFMKDDPEYRTWFLSEQPKTLPAEQPGEAEPAVTLPAAVEVEPESVEENDKPKRGRRKKAADEDNEDA